MRSVVMVYQVMGGVSSEGGDWEGRGYVLVVGQGKIQWVRHGMVNAVEGGNRGSNRGKMVHHVHQVKGGNRESG